MRYDLFQQLLQTILKNEHIVTFFYSTVKVEIRHSKKSIFIHSFKKGNLFCEGAPIAPHQLRHRYIFLTKR